MDPKAFIYIASAVAFAGAAFLAYYDKEGWGWLIFAGILGLAS
jgi:uncharacterized membrane protein HdeD (DUF308 family)